MKRVLIPALFLLLALGAFAQSVDGFFVEYGLTIESELSLGSVAAAIRTNPEDSGADALLRREDLEAAGTASAPQTVLDSTALLGVTVGLRTGDSVIAVVANAVVLQSPGGYRGAASAIVAPADALIAVTRHPRSWNGGVTEVRFGRIRLIDSGSVIIDQLADGAGFSVRFPRVFIEAGAGTTRFIDSFLYSARLSAADGAVFADDAVLAPERMIAVVRGEYGPIAGQYAGLSFVAYDDREPGTGLQAFYAGLAAKGPIVGFVSHETDIVLQGATDSSAPAILAGTTLFADLAAIPVDGRLGVHWSSGDSSGLSRYRPVTAVPVSSGVGVSPGDLLWLDFAAGVDLAAAAGRDPLRPEVASVLLMSPGSSAPWLGFEATAGISAELLGGVFVNAYGGVTRSPLGWSPLFAIKGRLEL
jgi:hypothetical protein